MAEHHVLMGGKLHLYKRENSEHWQCSAYLAGKNWRKSTKEESLSHAKEIAEDWYLVLRGKARGGDLKTGKTFREAVKHFLAEYLTLVAPERNPHYMENCEMRLRAHLLPFFGDKVLSEITSGLVQQYRVHRMTVRRPRPIKRKLKEGEEPPHYPVPTRSTLHQEIVALRQVLKAANRQGWLEYVPDLAPPYKASGKITHRAWFSPEEYQNLYQETRRRAKKPLHNRHRWDSEQFHDFVLFMANTGLRPDEAARLEFRDVKIVKDRATKETILEIEVRGKRGVGWCKSTTGAVLPFERLRDRLRPEVLPESDEDAPNQASTNGGKPRLVKPNPTDRLYPTNHRQCPHELQPSAHLHLHAPHGGRRHLPDRQELSHQRRNDRKILRHPHQDDARCECDQRAEGHHPAGTQEPRRRPRGYDPNGSPSSQRRTNP
jgi:integrase